MSEPKYVLVAHMGHDAPWLQIKTREEVKERIAHIKKYKPERERPLRLKLLKIVKDPLPPKLQRAYAAREKAYAARDKAYAARAEANAARAEANAARAEANAAWEKANAAWAEANAAREKAYAARAEANAAWEKANAAWEKAINSPVGVAFHKQVCGCAWTPEQPDILLQLATAQEEQVGL